MWLGKGTPAYKIVLGVVPYGRSYALKDRDNNGIDAPAMGPGKPGPITVSPGVLAFYEIRMMREHGVRLFSKQTFDVFTEVWAWFVSVYNSIF